MSTPSREQLAALGALSDTLKTSWHRFLDLYEPLRPELFRYCRYLTRSPWDAEDLAQDALARAFVTMGCMNQAPPNPRAWLFRVASNLWIDRTRQQREAPGSAPEIASTEAEVASHEPRVTREAAGTLIARLSPQERAAVVLKDVFDLTLEETAEALSTTTGGIKAALHRGRGKLIEPAPHEERTTTPAVLDAFCEAFNARDLDRLTALLLDNVTVEVVGVTTEYGPEAARRTVLNGMLYGSERLARCAPTAASRSCCSGTPIRTARPCARSTVSRSQTIASPASRTTSSTRTSSPTSAASSTSRSASTATATG